MEDGNVGAGFKPALHPQSQYMMLFVAAPHISKERCERSDISDDLRLLSEGGFETRPYIGRYIV
jgi:hypothetical protein